MDQRFKFEWKKLSKQHINNMYATDVNQWLTSHFNICKHLICQKGSVTPEFFNNIKRNSQPSFLTKINMLPFIENKENHNFNNNDNYNGNSIDKVAC